MGQSQSTRKYIEILQAVPVAPAPFIEWFVDYDEVAGIYFQSRRFSAKP